MENQELHIDAEKQEKVSLYKKILLISKEINAMDIKKSGYNGFIKYRFVELNDFLPELLDLCDKHNIFPSYNMAEDSASLTLRDLEDGQELVTTINLSKIKFDKGSPQELGALITYTRRYLFIAAFNISIADTGESNYKGDSSKAKYGGQNTVGNNTNSGSTLSSTSGGVKTIDSVINKVLELNGITKLINKISSLEEAQRFYQTHRDMAPETRKEFWNKCKSIGLYWDTENKRLQYVNDGERYAM
jgi:hypothetical protein